MNIRKMLSCNFSSAIAAIGFLLVISLIVATPPAAAKMTDQEKAKAQTEIRKEVKNTLDQLYKLHPSAKGAISKAAGYAVFSNLGVNVILLSGAHGKGMAIDNSTKKETFMKMISGGVGIGLGVKDFRAIFVFDTKEALNSFITSGWDASGQVDAAAKAGKKGGAVSGATSVAPGVWVYQITKNGLAAQATLQGTKYSKDDALN
jgi:lipid-binding SYLF domain-containing protein